MDVTFKTHFRTQWTASTKTGITLNS